MDYMIGVNYWGSKWGTEMWANWDAESVLFTAPKHFHFKNPNLKAEIVGDEIVVRADAYAKSVEIDSPDCDLRLFDNYFDINAGQKTVKILEGKPQNIRVRSVYDIR